MTDAERDAIVERVAKSLFCKLHFDHVGKSFDAARAALEAAGYFDLLAAAEDAEEYMTTTDAEPLATVLRDAIRRAKEGTR